MKLILRADVKGLGKKGELVKASDGYARNFLFPKGLAVEADAQNMTEFENAKKAERFKHDTELEKARLDGEKISGQTLSVKARAGTGGRLFGSVTAKEVAELLEKSYGIKADKRKLKLPEIKSFGTYNAVLKLYGGTEAQFKVFVSEED